jgi:hypothetical protein
MSVKACRVRESIASRKSVDWKDNRFMSCTKLISVSFLSTSITRPNVHKS